MATPDDPVPRIPVSTYRLQFNRHFRFADARAIVAYLHELGISDVYSSPYFKAVPGSLHGYDIVDPRLLNPEVGTEEEYNAFMQTLQQYGMGQILDIVPNHMAWGSDNPWWMDVLENGSGSPSAGFFAIDWLPPARKLAGKLLLPFLAKSQGETLEKGELELVFRQGAFFVRYGDLRLPLLPESYILILTHRLEILRDLSTAGDADLSELLSIVAALRHLPPVTEKDETKLQERYREKGVSQRRLYALCRRSAGVRKFLEENVRIFNGVPGEPASFDLLEGLLAKQVWRLTHWVAAQEEVNYRRFFDISSLAAVRSEDPAVFQETHALIFRLIAEKKVTGLRIDHPDGLYDPQQYLERLQRCCLALLTAPPRAAGAPEEPADRELLSRSADLPAAVPRCRPFYIIAEKILTGDEEMPPEWPVFGTTGYDYLNLVNGIFVDEGTAREFTDLYAWFSGAKKDFPALAVEKKRFLMDTTLAAEINHLAFRLSDLAEKSRRSRDFTLRSLRKAITEVIAFFPVYRSYIHSPTVADRDRNTIEAAVTEAKRNNPLLGETIFAFLHDLLLLKFPLDFGDADKRNGGEFLMRFQQTTAPVMAKGVEDTALYDYNRLVSLNEVGGSPDRFGVSVQAFHDRNRERLSSWPHALLATSTHDTKRSEDVRARINVLSEIPEEWRHCLTRWRRLNEKNKANLRGRIAPDAQEEYLLYQTLLGAWPLGQVSAEERGDFKRRVRDYMVKALREAKVHTSWINPDGEYESAVASFIEAILTDGPDNEFLRDFAPFQKSISYFGMVNSLSQTLLKMVSPGVPDFFQGTELWNFSLVDPDNRRPVNFADRQASLAALKKEMAVAGPDLSGFLGRLLAGWEDGAIKQYTIMKALNFRKENPSLFQDGVYVAFAGEGELPYHICGFARLARGRAVLAVVPRLMAKVVKLNPAVMTGKDVWGKTALLLSGGIPGRVFKNVLTGEKIEAVGASAKRFLPLDAVFSFFPVAMLTTEEFS